MQTGLIQYLGLSYIIFQISPSSLQTLIGLLNKVKILASQYMISHRNSK